MYISLSAVLMYAFMAVVCGIMLLAIKRREQDQIKRAEWDRQEVAKRVEEAVKRDQERRLHQLKDEQLNHGRRVYNWLSEILEWPMYQGLGFHIEKTEGDVFLIHIFLNRDNVEPPMRVLQLDYDFARDWNQRAHIFYGDQGPDIDFAADRSLPFDYGLPRLVIQTLAGEAEYRRREIKTPAA